MVDGPDENLNQDAAPPVCPTCGGAIPRETGQDGSSADGLPDWGSAVRGLGLAPESPPDVARGLDDGTNLVGRTAGEYSTFNEFIARRNLHIVPRGVWSKVAPDAEHLRRFDGYYTGIILHHTGSETTPEQVEALQREQEPYAKVEARRLLSKIGLANNYDDYGDVGYHFMVAPDGTIYQGRDLHSVGAHVEGHNTGNVGIAFLGDYSDRPLSQAAAHSGLQLMGALRDFYRMGADGKPFISTHAQYNAAKRNELRGANPQVNFMERRLEAGGQ